MFGFYGRELAFRQVLTNFLDFGFQDLVFRQLAGQEALGEISLGRNAFWGQYIGVASLVSRGAEVSQFDQSLFDKGAQNIMHAASAHAESFCQVALAEFGVGLE